VEGPDNPSDAPATSGDSLHHHAGSLQRLGGSVRKVPTNDVTDFVGQHRMEFGGLQLGNRTCGYSD
jgi:hypothetical protein